LISLIVLHHDNVVEDDDGIRAYPQNFPFGVGAVGRGGLGGAVCNCSWRAAASTAGCRRHEGVRQESGCCGGQLGRRVAVDDLAADDRGEHH